MGCAVVDLAAAHGKLRALNVDITAAIGGCYAAVDGAAGHIHCRAGHNIYIATLMGCFATVDSAAGHIECTAIDIYVTTASARAAVDCATGNVQNPTVPDRAAVAALYDLGGISLVVYCRCSAADDRAAVDIHGLVHIADNRTAVAVISDNNVCAVDRTAVHCKALDTIRLFSSCIRRIVNEGKRTKHRAVGKIDLTGADRIQNRQADIGVVRDHIVNADVRILCCNGIQSNRLAVKIKADNRIRIDRIDGS